MSRSCRPEKFSRVRRRRRDKGLLCTLNLPNVNLAYQQAARKFQAAAISRSLPAFIPHEVGRTFATPRGGRSKREEGRREMPGVRDGSGRRYLAEALHLPCFRKHRSHTDGVTQDALGRSTSQAQNRSDQNETKAVLNCVGVQLHQTGTPGEF